MYELFRFINSANIPYAKIDLDGNIHIEGRNGTGKSTILRAILFFYNSSSRKLGIAEHQNKFVDFYLPYENSYILFEVGKEQATYLVVLFRSKNRPCFRIINSAYDQSLFLDESKQARFPNQMPSIIAAKNLDPPTRIIDKHEEFRNIIYGIPSDKTHRQYSLFETKSYENIPRAITNIFLNYKLESDFIKQSVVHSLVDPDDERYKIDVKILKKPLEDFQGNLEDIEVYQRNETTANKIIQLYDTIINIEIDKKLLAQKLGGSIKWANVEKNNLQKMLQLLEMEIEKLSDRLKYNENQYQQEQRLLNDKISVLNHQIQLAKNKQKEYQTINIESIIQNVNNKSFIENQLQDYQGELTLLTKTVEDIEAKFNLEKENLKQRHDNLMIEIKTKENDYEKQVLEKKNHLNDSYQKKLEEKHNSFEKQFETLKETMEKQKDILRDKQIQKNNIKNSRPFAEEIKKLKDQLSELKENMTTVEAGLVQANNKISQTENEIEQKKKQTEQTIRYQIERYQNDSNNLKTELKELEDKLKVNEKSFLYFLENNFPDYKNNVAKVCSEELFFRDDLNPQITTGNQTSIFGVSIDLNRLQPIIKTREEYKQQRQNILNQMQLLEKNNLSKIQETEQKTELWIKEKNEFMGKQFKLISDSNKDKAIKKFQHDKLRSEESKLNEKGKKQIQQQSRAIDDIIESELKKLQDVQSSINQLKTDKSALLSSLKIEQTELTRILDADQEKFLQEMERQKNTNNQSYQDQLASLEENRLAILSEKGIDSSIIKALEEKIDSAKKQLDQITKQEKIVIEYLKDKKEYIDQISVHEKEKSELKKNRDGKNKDYEFLKSQLTKEKELKTNQHKERQNNLKAIYEGINNFERFKANPLYLELENEIEQSYDESKEPLSDLITQLNDQDQIFQRKKSQMNEMARQFAGHFRVNNILKFDTHFQGEKDESIRTFAQNLKDFVSEKKINIIKREVSTHYGQVMRDLSHKYNDLNSKIGDIQKVISAINRNLEKSQFVGAIKKIELRFLDSDNKIINNLKTIAEFSRENPFDGEINVLFNTNPNQEKNQKAIDLLNTMQKNINADNSPLSLQDSFKLQLRVIENNNDTGFVEKLSRVGSTGTDILVKAMIYITLLNVATENFSKKIKDYKIHCIIDEVGTLASSYLEELIKFANDKDIFLINGSPDNIEPLAYDRLYHVSKENETNNTVIKRILAKK